jgi:hypothetical protein
LYGAGDWGLLAVMQKVTFLCFMLLVLTIEYFTRSEDFQQKKLNSLSVKATNR